MPTCREKIISQDYADYIVEYNGVPEEVYDTFQTDCVQFFNERFAVFYQPVLSMQRAVNTLTYSSIPKLFGLMDTSSMDSSGITRIHNQPYLDLLGQNIIVGIIDTGIDYTNPVFRNSDGTSRIIGLWDQTIETTETESASAGVTTDFGTVYSKEEIDTALLSTDPLTIVPSTDADGHGTFVAGIAAGSRDLTNDFVGAAPRADIAVVKLKPAKEYLRQYYIIEEGAPAYQENDIMAGVAYLMNLSRALRKPVSICIGLGTNSGDHSGGSYISRYLDMAGSTAGTCITIAAGNEANRGCHFLGNLPQTDVPVEVELRVGDGENGFITELWGFSPDIYSIAIISPSGESTGRISPKIGVVQRFTFSLEPSIVFVNYRIVESASGGQVILIRMQAPVPGIWRIQVYGTNLLTGRFHMWLPIHQFITEDTYFLQPQPDMTVTAPGEGVVSLSIGAYNHINNSIYLYSGRGFTPTGLVVPDLCAPGVNVFGPGLRGRYTTRSGTSVAAAHVCGASALLLQWGIYERSQYTMSTIQVKQYLIRGANRQEDIIYPSRIWGYGTLDIYHVFEIFIT